MIISNNSVMGSFVLSVIAPLRMTDNGRERLAKPAAGANRRTLVKPPRRVTREHVASTNTIDIGSLQETVLTKPLEPASAKFTPGHRRSGATLTSISQFVPPNPQERASLNNFANTLRSKMQEYDAHMNSKPSLTGDKEPAAPLSPIEEEVEEDRTDISTCTHDSGPSSSSSDAASHDAEFSSRSSDTITCIVEEETDLLTKQPVSGPSRLGCSSQQSADDSDTITSLKSENTRLKFEIGTADQEIQNLNAELADACDLEQLVQEAEERMEELLIEKTEWSKTQRALTQNLALVTDDLQNAKHCKTLLQHDNERLREIIQYYKISMEALCPQPKLLHQNAIDRCSAELVWPFSPIRPSDHHQEAGNKKPLLPPNVNHDYIIRSYSVSNDTTSSTPTPSLAKSLATPPRTPSLRSTKSLRLRESSSLRLRTSMSKVSSDGSPVRQDYKPAEGSPLKVVSTLPISDDEGSSAKMEKSEWEANGFLFPSPVFGKTSPQEQLDDENDDIRFYDCNEVFELGEGSSSGRTSRLGMLPGDFWEDGLL